MKMRKLTLFTLCLFVINTPSFGQKTVRVNNGLSLGEPIEWVESLLNFFGLGSRSYRNCLGKRKGVTECLGSNDGAKFVKSSFTGQQMEGVAELSDLIEKGVDCDPFGATEFLEPRKVHEVSLQKCGAFFLHDIEHFEPDVMPMTKVYSCHKFFCDQKVLDELKKVGLSEDRPDSEFPGIDDPESYYGCSVSL